jgi:hypothetical protein
MQASRESRANLTSVLSLQKQKAQPEIVSTSAGTATDSIVRSAKISVRKSKVQRIPASNLNWRLTDGMLIVVRLSQAKTFGSSIWAMPIGRFSASMVDDQNASALIIRSSDAASKRCPEWEVRSKHLDPRTVTQTGIVMSTIAVIPNALSGIPQSSSLGAKRTAASR